MGFLDKTFDKVKKTVNEAVGRVVGDPKQIETPKNPPFPENEENVVNELPERKKLSRIEDDREVLVSPEQTKQAMKKLLEISKAEGESTRLEKLNKIVSDYAKDARGFFDNITQSILNKETKLEPKEKASLAKKFSDRFSPNNVKDFLLSQKDDFKENLPIVLVGAGARVATKVAAGALGSTLGVAGGAGVVGALGILGVAATAGALAKGAQKIYERKYGLRDGDNLIRKLGIDITGFYDANILAMTIVESQRLLDRDLIDLDLIDIDEYKAKNSVSRAIGDARGRLSVYLKERLEVENGDSFDNKNLQIAQFILDKKSENLNDLSEKEAKGELAQYRKWALDKLLKSKGRKLGTDDRSKILKASLAGAGLGLLGGTLAQGVLAFFSENLPESVLPKEVKEIKKFLPKIDDYKQPSFEGIKMGAPVNPEAVVSVSEDSAQKIIDKVSAGSSLNVVKEITLDDKDVLKIGPDATFMEKFGISSKDYYTSFKEMRNLAAKEILGASELTEDWDKRLSGQQVLDITNKTAELYAKSLEVADGESAADKVSNIALPKVGFSDLSEFQSSTLEIAKVENIMPEDEIVEVVSEVPKPPEQPVDNGYWSGILKGLGITGVVAGATYGIKKVLDIKSSTDETEKDKAGQPNGNNENYMPNDRTKDAEIVQKFAEIDNEEKAKVKKGDKSELKESKLKNNAEVNKYSLEELRSLVYGEDNEVNEEEEPFRLIEELEADSILNNIETHEFIKTDEGEVIKRKVNFYKRDKNGFLVLDDKNQPQVAMQMEVDQEAIKNFIDKNEILKPQFVIDVNSDRVYTSMVYKNQDGRNSIVMYVPFKNNEGSLVYIPRTYYQSGSQNQWRYLPSMAEYRSPILQMRYDKGYGEESLAAPPIVQEALAKIFSEQNYKPINIERPEIIFGGLSPEVAEQFINSKPSTVKFETSEKKYAINVLEEKKARVQKILLLKKNWLQILPSLTVNTTLPIHL